jgi:hypothetical protein
MDPRLRLTLSPIALATALALAAAPSVVPVPWFAIESALANHCTTGCDAPPCDCVCVCDSGGCCAEPDDEDA